MRKKNPGSNASTEKPVFYVTMYLLRTPTHRRCADLRHANVLERNTSLVASLDCSSIHSVGEASCLLSFRPSSPRSSRGGPLPSWKVTVTRPSWRVSEPPPSWRVAQILCLHPRKSVMPFSFLPSTPAVCFSFTNSIQPFIFSFDLTTHRPKASAWYLPRRRQPRTRTPAIRSRPRRRQPR